MKNNHVEKGAAGPPLLHRGSDARIVMATDEIALVRLWRKTRRVEPEDTPGTLLSSLGQSPRI